ncbi:MAG: tetratricopeptide repeat protein [bacterium]
MAFLFLLPLTLWLYLPIRSSMHPPLNWGCPDNWQRFVEHLSAKSYQRNVVALSIGSLKSRIIPHLGFFTHQFNIWLIFLGLLGLIFLLAKSPKLGVFLLLMAITNMLLAIRYDISNIEDYYIPSFLILCLLIGYFLFSLLSLSSKLIPIPYSLIPKTALSLLFLILPIQQCKANYHSSDHSDHYIAYDYGRNMLDPLRDKALVFLEGRIDQPIFLFWYLQNIENLRNDVAVVEINLLPFQYYINELKEKYSDINLTSPIYIQIIENNLKNRPLYVRYDERLMEMYKAYSLIPEGIFWRVVEKVDDKKVYEEILTNKVDFKIREIKFFVKENISLEDRGIIQIILLYGRTFDTRGNYYALFQQHNLAIGEFERAIELLNKLGMDKAKKEREVAIAFFISVLYHLGNTFHQQGDLDKAIFEFEKGLKLSPENINLHGQLGVVYFEKGLKDKAIKKFETILKLEPNNIQARQNLAILKKQ